MEGGSLRGRDEWWENWFVCCGLMKALSVPLYDCRHQSVVEQYLPLFSLKISYSA